VTTLLEVEHLAVGYGDALAVFDATLHVDAGEIVALLGPNGAGKTTTLMTISGFLRPTRGCIRLDGRDTGKRSPHEIAGGGVGFVPDDRALIPGLTVAENLAIVRHRVVEPFDLFPELARLAGRRAGLLSGGEQQMLGLARVLASRPRLLLIDELSLGLSPLIVNRLMEAIRAAADQFGSGVLLVEQHVEKALDVSDRTYVMLHGRIVLEGASAQLRVRRDLLEASYMGESAVHLGSPG
jgi:branched-chain amino acid transport system ATP-binding protein